MTDRNTIRRRLAGLSCRACALLVVLALVGSACSGTTRIETAEQSVETDLPAAAPRGTLDVELPENASDRALSLFSKDVSSTTATVQAPVSVEAATVTTAAPDASSSTAAATQSSKEKAKPAKTKQRTTTTQVLASQPTATAELQATTKPIETTSATNATTAAESTIRVTTEAATTTKRPTTTAKPTTTKAPTTTAKPTTTKAPTTTAKPTTTKAPTTTAKPTTTKAPTTTAKPTTTKAPTTTAKPTTTKAPDTTAVIVGVPDNGRFGMLPPGATLPSGEWCAARVRPAVEVRPENNRHNATRGVSANDDYPRVDGNYTGTTDEIIQWGACKWGIDEDIVRSQATIESWWMANNEGDPTDTPIDCHPSLHRAGPCPRSVGLLQIKYPFNKAAFENANAIKSTAYNVDYSLAKTRECFEGKLHWLNDVERGRQYGAGDIYGCMGVWYSGHWYAQRADWYINRIKNDKAQRTWEDPDFIKNGR